MILSSYQNCLEMIFIYLTVRMNLFYIRFDFEELFNIIQLFHTIFDVICDVINFEKKIHFKI